MSDDDGWFYPGPAAPYRDSYFPIVLHIRGTKGTLLRFKSRDLAQAVIDKWLSDGWSQLPDVRSIHRPLP